MPMYFTFRVYRITEAGTSSFLKKKNFLLSLGTNFSARGEPGSKASC